jgi:hypothetical protein
MSLFSKRVFLLPRPVTETTFQYSKRSKIGLTHLWDTLRASLSQMVITTSLRCQKVTACMVTPLPLSVLPSPRTLLSCTSGTKWSPLSTPNSEQLTTLCSYSLQTPRGVLSSVWVQVLRMMHTLTRKFTTWREKGQSTDAKFADSVLRLFDWRMSSARNKTTTLWCSQLCHTSTSVKKISRLTWPVFMVIDLKQPCRPFQLQMSIYMLMLMKQIEFS